MAITGTDFNTTNGVQNNTSNNNTVQKPGGELGKEAFLQLMITQMQYQDPLDPQDNSEAIAQMAQFSALEQMTNLNSSMDKLSGIIGNMDLSMMVGQLSGFIGKDIRWTTEEADGTTKIHTGKVTAVKIVDGIPTLLAKDSTNEDKITAVNASQINGIGDLVDLGQGLDPEENKK